MVDVTFTTSSACTLDDCRGCPVARRDMDTFGLFAAWKRRFGDSGCRRVDPRTVGYKPPNHYTVLEDTEEQDDA
jgi:hypothetical protein